MTLAKNIVGLQAGLFWGKKTTSKMWGQVSEESHSRIAKEFSVLINATKALSDSSTWEGKIECVDTITSDAYPLPNCRVRWGQTASTGSNEAGRQKT